MEPGADVLHDTSDDPLVRMMHMLTGIENLRDVAVGPMVKGVVYRSAKLEEGTELGLRALADPAGLNIRSVVDVRAHEDAKRPNRLPAEVQWKVVEMFERGGGASLFNKVRDHGVEKGFALGYMSWIESGGRSVAAVCRNLLCPETVPTLFHCLSGKDRTGCIAMILQLLAGTPDALIVENYAETARHIGGGGLHKRGNLKGPIDYLVKISKEQLPIARYIEEYGVETLANIMRSEPGSMQELLKLFRSKYHTAEHYLTMPLLDGGAGLAPVEVEHVQAVLLGEDPEVAQTAAATVAASAKL